MIQAQKFQTKKKLGRCAIYAFIFSLCFGLGSCEQTEKMRQTIDQRAGEAKQTLDAAKKEPPHPVTYDPLTVTNKVWGGNVALRMHRGVPLPARYEDARGVTLVSAAPMSLNDIANAISAQTGIPIRLVAMTIPGKGSASSSTTTSSSSSSSSSIMDSSTSSPSASQKTAPSVGNSEMPVSYEGPLSGLLDRLSAYFGVNWHFDGSAITVSRFETRVFAVEALPGTQEINEGMQDDVNSSSGSGSSSGSTSSSSISGSSSSSSSGSQNTLTQNSTTKIELKYWDELTSVLNSMVGGQGTAIISPTMGTVTVTTTPDVMATVADYIAKENKRLSRQIAINVQIYNVNLGQSEDYNIAFTGVLNRLASLHYTSAAVPGILNPNLTTSSLGTLSVAILNNSGDQSNASDILQALSTVGDTSEVAEFPMTTLNNRPVSRRVGTDTSYVSSITQTENLSTTTGTSPAIVTPVVSTIHAGYSLQLTPRLLDDGRILLQYSLSLIDYPGNPQTACFGGTGTDCSGGSTVTLPITNNRIFVQQSMLRSGQTLVIGGVDQENASQSKQGVGSPDNPLLGGGISGDANHLMLFMAITPQVLDVGADEEHG